ncbi:MAG: alpha/beta fold hydrolase [Labilithrix sp.]|nr:alpha/beta fold hydrolase [Labilithrix sp.]
MNANPDLKKSTTVRPKRPTPVALRAAKAGLRVLSPRAPALAARWAEHLFLTARRHERPSWEAEALASARPGRVRHEGGFVPTWTWSPPGARRSLETPPTVILVHGWEGRGSQLSAFVPRLVERGLRVVAFDAPGHGDSPLPRASVVEHARALASVGRAFGPARAVIGHSVGGAAALLATRFGFEAERLALIAPPTTPKGFAATFARTLGLDDALEAAMIARLESRYGLRLEDLDVGVDARRLRAPLLVIHDREDPVVAFESGRLLARAAPHGELVAVTGLGHGAILRAPHVVDAVSAFVGAAKAEPSFAETLDGELFLRDARW